MSLRMLLVFDWGVFELARRNRKQMERLGHRHASKFSADPFREIDAVFDRRGSEVRPIGRDQNIPVQSGSPSKNSLVGYRIWLEWHEVASTSLMQVNKFVFRVHRVPPFIPLYADSPAQRLNSYRSAERHPPTSFRSL